MVQKSVVANGMDDRPTAFAEEPRLITEPGRAARVAAIAEPVLAELGYRLVRVRVSGVCAAARFRSWPSGRTARWRSRTARPPRARSRRCSTSPTRSKAPIGWRSPRPALIGRWCGASDFDRYAGHVAKIEMLVPIDGRRRFRGELIGTEGDCVRLRSAEPAAGESPDVLLPIDDMMEARLVLTDALISQALRRSKHGDKPADARGARASK